MEPGIVVANESAPAEPSSVATLVQHCLPSVERWARGRLPRSARREFDTRDLVQEAALRLLQRGRRFEPRHAYAVQAYMQQTVLNLARDQGRRIARSEQVELREDFPCQEAGPLERAISQERRARYEEALRSLTPKERRLVSARVDGDLKAADIADACGLPSADAARMAVARACKRLIHKLSRLK